MDPPADMVGRCVYTNPFSRGEECKLYSGAQWTVDAAVADCAAVFAGTAGAFAAEAECGFGECSDPAPWARPTPRATPW
ncbi:MAG: hypothetical protein R3F43_00230 [bacterium]